MSELKYIEDLLSNNKNIVNWRYTGPSDKAKLIVQGDNLLHLAAKIKNEGTFVEICKENIALVTARNEYGNNPFHAAAKSGILLPAVKKIVEDINNKMKKAEEARRWEEKWELERHKQYIKTALCDKSCILHKRIVVAPLYFLDSAERKEVKQIADIKGSFVCNGKFHLCLYIIGAIACIAALCLSLYFLFLVSQSLALASVATIASGRSTCLLFKACNGIYGLYDGSTIATDSDAMQLVGGCGLGVA
ncbi:MAG: ankyrin repeat domain-containing protein [Wolbachia endosymbiont of Alcedoecus sp.]|nr:ankyrin repeat domain-containing protein [Wolbachia endosymbiont of Alcedoecus sp.]